MQETRQFTLDPGQLTVTASVQTDPGCVRDSNEDSGRHVNPYDLETLASRGRLTIVCDGMGGHASGEVASQIAVEAINELYYSNRDLDPQAALRWAIEQANCEIYETSLTDESYAGMGTTLVAMVILGDKAFSAHVGDSRLYRMRGQKLELLTMDHSQVMEMVQQGIITMEQARNHDDKNVILRAVGTNPEVEVDVSAMFAIEPGDTFLLCSDGLNDMLEDAEIEAILASESDEYLACQQLIEAAKQSGGHDNVTVGVVNVSAKIAAPPQQARITREVEAL
ncbi:MAG: Stp1/IreP family PP2C-type Ser/Thr phosphatase [Acidobacteria bacterium]|nr:Stp1/IreP family PP2C-type Ser/Thr phosphatase [Acidobacteriota bacterium]